MDGVDRAADRRAGERHAAPGEGRTEADLPGRDGPLRQRGVGFGRLPGEFAGEDPAGGAGDQPDPGELTRPADLEQAQGSGRAWQQARRLPGGLAALREKHVARLARRARIRELAVAERERQRILPGTGVDQDHGGRRAGRVVDVEPGPPVKGGGRDRGPAGGAVAGLGAEHDRNAERAGGGCGEFRPDNPERIPGLAFPGREHEPLPGMGGQRFLQRGDRKKSEVGGLDQQGQGRAAAAAEQPRGVAGLGVRDVGDLQDRGKPAVGGGRGGGEQGEHQPRARDRDVPPFGQPRLRPGGRAGGGAARELWGLQELGESRSGRSQRRGAGQRCGREHHIRTILHTSAKKFVWGYALESGNHYILWLVESRFVSSLTACSALRTNPYESAFATLPPTIDC